MMENNTNLYRLYFGLNDQKAKIQLISTEDALNMMSDYLANHFAGATIFSGIGVYRHENGTVVKENSLIVELCFVSEDEVNEVINQFKKVLNQESVMKVTLPCNVDFIG